MVGIENTLKLIEGLGKSGTALGKILDDGAVDLSDIVHLKDAFSVFMSFTDVDYDEIVPELSNVTEAKILILGDAFDLHFDLETDSLEATIEAGFDILLELVGVIKFLKKIIGMVKK